MINNVRIRARKRKRELERLNIVIYTKHFDTTYKDTSDNYTEGMYMFVYSFNIVNSKI